MKKLILKLLLSLVTLTTATTITLAKDYGFKVTNRELSKAELLKQISNRKI